MMDNNSNEKLFQRIDEFEERFLKEVDLYYMQGQEVRGNAAFESWDVNFRAFLEKEMLPYLQRYDQFIIKNRKSKLLSFSPYDNWKRSYGTSVLAFLEQLKEDIKAGIIIEYSPKNEIPQNNPLQSREGKIFIGHGHSDIWRKIKDFIVDRLQLNYEEYNREPTPGLSRKERLSQMIEHSIFALIIMTPEDEYPDGSLHARESVIHEIGFFQGRLGFTKAIVLLEEGCSEFSNIHGIDQIRFPKNNIESTFEEIRRVLEREGIL